MQGRLFAIILAAATFTLPALCLSQEAANPPNRDYVNALWVAESGGVLKVATAEGDILFEIPYAHDTRALAVDSRRGRLWTFASQTLRVHGFDGALQMEVSVPVEEEDDKHVRLAVDDETGAAWLGHHSTLRRFTPQGTLVRTVNLGAVLADMSHDTDGRRLWVAADRKLVAYDEEGNVATQVDLGKQIPRAIEFDPRLKEVWVALQGRLVRYAPTGNQTFSASFRKVEHLAADGQGGLWFATDRVLRRTDGSGAVLFELEPFHGGPSTLVDLVADPAELSAWASTSKEIARIDTEGVIRNSVDLRGRSGFGSIRATAIYADTVAPELDLTAPVDGTFTNDAQVTFHFTYSDIGIGVDTELFALLVNHTTLDVTCSWTAESGSCVPVQPLLDGDYDIEASVADYAGNVSEPVTLDITVDTLPPVITVRSPEDGSYTNQATQTIRGSVDEPADVSISGKAITLDIDNAFTYGATLVEGHNHFAITAVDRAGNPAHASLSIVLDTIPPAGADIAGISVEFADGTAVVTGDAGSVEPGTLVTIINSRTGESVTVTADGEGRFLAVIAAEAGDLLSVEVADRAGNSSGHVELPTGDRTVPIPNYAPHDPAAVAPPLDPTTPTTLFSATEFLYSGDNRIQFGMEPETIEAKRAAVLRGRVFTQNGTPLPGVTITVLYHPEFGWTGTRKDGLFDIAVNGGGYLTVNRLLK